MSARDERRLVTSLFADISGFTTLSEQLDDPEALHDIISPVIARLAAIAERYDGFIAKFAGDALLVFFGAPVAREDDPVRALLVAAEMHEALPGIVSDLPPEASGLELHIGVNTGRVISGRYGGEGQSDYSILGDAVILAQRLESVAPSGETYVGQSTYELTREQFEFESVGELSLKGKTLPVPAWRLLGPRLPTLSATWSTDVPLLGRDRERQAIDEAFAQLPASNGVLAFIGEAGIGKTRLLGVARQSAMRRRLRWFQARCLSYGADLAYWPVADLFRQILGIRVDERPAQVDSTLRERLAGVPDALPFVARLLGVAWPRSIADDLTPEAFRRRLHAAVGEALEHLAHGDPYVVAVEDVQWADSSSLALLEDLAGAAGSSTTVVVTSRPEGRDAVRRLVDASPGWDVLVDVGPLDERGVEELARALLDGDEPPTGLTAELHGRTSGNPFFAAETVRVLRDCDALVRRHDGRWELRPEWRKMVPDSVERVLGARLDLLHPDAARLLQTMAVVGRVVRRTLLDAVVADPALLHRVGELLAGGLVETATDAGESSLMFHHALVQDVAYQRLLHRQRTALHRRTAEVAERLYGQGDEVIDLLARHLWLGEVGPRAAPYLVRAGHRARRVFATEEAIVHLERAVDAADGGGSTVSAAAVLLELGELERLRGGYQRSIERYEDAAARGEVLRGHLGVAQTRRRTGDYDEALAALDLIDDAVRGDDLAEVWHERAAIHLVSGRPTQAAADAERGLAAVRDRRSPLAGRLLVPLAHARAVTGHPEDALELALEARSVLQELEDPVVLAQNVRLVGGLLTTLGMYDEAADAFHQSLAHARRVGSTEDAAFCLMNLGVVDLERGRLDDAIGWDKEALEEFSAVGHRSGIAHTLANLGYKLVHAGRLDEATELLDEAKGMASDLDAQALQAEIRHSQATLELRRGDRTRAGELADDAARRWDALGAAERADECRKLAAEARQPSTVAD